MQNKDNLDCLACKTNARLLALCLSALLGMSLMACKKSELASATPTQAATTKAAKPAGPLSYQTLEWTDLMPQSDLDAILNPPDYVTEVVDGSLADQISGELKNKPKAVRNDAYQRALSSTKVVANMNNKPIRLPGFIVPLGFNDQLAVTQFFLVPFFGACIHVPPPPPNQIIFVDYPKGLDLGDMYSPIWVSGMLKTTLVENQTATSAYSMQLDAYELYTEDGLDGP